MQSLRTKLNLPSLIVPAVKINNWCKMEASPSPASTASSPSPLFVNDELVWDKASGKPYPGKKEEAKPKTKLPPIAIPLFIRPLLPAPSSAGLPPKSEPVVKFSNVDVIHEFVPVTPLPSPGIPAPAVDPCEEDKVYLQAKGVIPDTP